MWGETNDVNISDNVVHILVGQVSCRFVTLPQWLTGLNAVARPTNAKRVYSPVDLSRASGPVHVINNYNSFNVRTRLSMDKE